MSDHAPPSPDEEALWGYISTGESRWPQAAAVVGIIVLQMLLPDQLTLGPRWGIPLIEVMILVVLAIYGPSKLDAEARDLRWVSLVLIAVLSIANAVTLGFLIDHLLHAGDSTPGRTLIFSSVAVWFTTVLAFGLWYWEIDRGGPIRRCTPQHRAPDFLFPQMSSRAATRGQWTPKFIDYLYVSLTNSTAFSPTDTMPLTTRAKALMSAQSLASLATVVIVGARAVNILK